MKHSYLRLADMNAICKSPSYYFISYVTGPSHVSLRVSVSSQPPQQIHLRKGPNLSTHTHGPQDEQEILRLISESVEYFNANKEPKFYISEAMYFEGDSPRYGFYVSCVKILFQHLHGSPEIQVQEVTDTYLFR